MKLFHRKIEGDPSKPTILLIHGLYSSSSNWYALARKMNYNILMVDLPNHGHSPWSDEFSYRAMADPIKELIDSPTIALGHSLGGRVAMILAAECPEVVGLIMIDISPVTTRKIDRAFGMFHSRFLSHLVEARKQNIENIEEYLVNVGASKDMTSAVDQAYRQMNIEVVAEFMSSLAGEWEELSSRYGLIEKPTMLVRGSASPYITDVYAERYSELLKNFMIETVEGGSHRLHHEYPEKFIGLVKKYVDTYF